MSKRDYTKQRRERTPALIELVQLGLTNPQIAQALSVSESTVQKDIVLLGGRKIFPHKPEKSDVFTAVLKRYARLIADKEENSIIQDACTRVLQEEKILNLLSGISLAMSTVTRPAYPKEMEGYVRLLSAIAKKDLTLKQIDAHDLQMCKAFMSRYWRRYLEGIAAEEIDAPASHGKLVDDILVRYVNKRRAHIMPVWPDNAREIVDGVLKRLPGREEDIVRKRYGCNDPVMTLEQVGECYFVTREQIRELQSRALRKLRHPSRKNKLGPLFRSLVGHVEHLSKENKALDKRLTIALTPVDEKKTETLNLLRRIDSGKDLSIRTVNVFDVAGIVYVGDLVQYRERDLLKCKNFGRKSLKEVNYFLFEMGLALGMTLDDSVILELRRMRKTEAHPA